MFILNLTSGSNFGEYYRKGSIYSVLDGQQRLSALYIGLKGSYAYKDYGVEWEDTTDSTLTRHLYLNISKEHSEETRLYEFKFLKRFFTNEKEIYETKYDTWFKVGEILNYTDEEEFDSFIERFNKGFPRKALRQLRRIILEKPIISYFLEEEQNLDRALDIYKIINSDRKH